MKRKLKKKPLSFVKKNLVLIFGCFVLLALSTIGYAALNQTMNISGDIAIRAVKDIRITGVELSATFEEGYEYYNSRYGTDSITLSAILPNVGSSVAYSATITNKGTVDMEVSDINAAIQSSLVAQLSTIAQTQYFECNITGLEEGNVIPARQSKTFAIEFKRIADSSNNYKNVELVVSLGLKESLPIEPYVEPILVGNDPDLLNNSLVPIMYDGTANNGDGSWIVASEYDAWYSYSNQIWANAVILEDGVTKNAGDPIIVPTADSSTTEVKAMYVWIPRYSYTIKSEDGTNYYGKTLSDLGASTASELTPGAIDIKFVNKLTNEDGTAQYTGNEVNNWRTHPAFNWDTNSDGSISTSEQLSGIWVGKFETGGTSTTPYILPNVKALTEKIVKNQFDTAKRFVNYLTNSTDTDSHMMKNSEWGSVAYLSQSIYGKYGNSSYTGANKEIYKNISFLMYFETWPITARQSLTGVSGNNPGSIASFAGCYYDNINDRGDGTGACGAGASTTGNIYGIYDMSGGASEYVMGYLTTANSNYATDSENYFGWTISENVSEFTSKPADKYFDNYTSTTITTACNSGICYGHALSETSGWYNGNMTFASDDKPWLIRGGGFSASSGGMFTSDVNNGSGTYEVGFRSVLVKE